MSDYTYYVFDDRLLARRKGYNMPELLGGEVKGEWRKYPDIERFDYNVHEISEDEFDRLLAERMKDLSKQGEPSLDNPYRK